MRAMVLHKITDLGQNRSPLVLKEIAKPGVSDREILIKVNACGVCHTEIDEIEGRTSPRSLPMVLGHQIAGVVECTGNKAAKFNEGQRVGVGWINSSCGQCRFCKEGNDNLCEGFSATGRDAQGGYAEYMTVDEDYAFLLPDRYTDAQAAPLLCAGAIGYRSIRLAGIKNGEPIGLMGFGASGHLMMKMLGNTYPDSEVYVFARNPDEREFALELGAAWAGDTEDTSPKKLSSIIDTTPVWKPVVEGLGNLERGGRLVINAIRKEEVDKDYLLGIDYARHIWMEKEIKSVANVTRADLREFLELADSYDLTPEVQTFPLEDANKAICELKSGKIRGAKVLIMD